MVHLNRKARAKKNRQAFGWRFFGIRRLSLAGPVRQQAGEVKEETEEPAAHEERFNHTRQCLANDQAFGQRTI
jgi:hypothetical protein